MLPEYPKALGTARSAIRELFEYGKKRAAEVGAENVFDFSIGNPSVPAPAEVNRTAIDLLQNNDSVILHGYTSAQGDADARALLAADLNTRFRAGITADQLYLTVGAAAALCCCFHGLTCPGDEFILFAPYFPEYKVFLQGAGASVKVVPAEIEAFQIDFEALERTITPATKGLVINSPNNPSGAVYSAETLKKLGEFLRAKQAEYGHPIYLITDEPYREIVFAETAPWVPHYYENTIVCYSFSKSLSLPGERIGYVLVPGSVTDSELVYACIAGAGRMLGYVNAPSLFQRVAAQCCQLTADLSVYKTNCRLLTDSLRSMGFHVVEPKGTFYLFPRTLEEDAAAFCRRAQEHDILIVPSDSFGCPGHFRLSFCVPTERIERALPAFERLAKSYR